MAPIRRVSNIEIENARIIYPNFSGKEGRYNREGERSFGVVIDDIDLAQRLGEDGWNIRVLKPRDGEETPNHYLNVSVNFNFWRRPEIYMICNGVKTLLDEESINVLDGAAIVSADVVVRPRQWDDGGDTRIKAYLQEMYITIEQSRFASKYSDM